MRCDPGNLVFVPRLHRQNDLSGHPQIGGKLAGDVPRHGDTMRLCHSGADCISRMPLQSCEAGRADRQLWHPRTQQPLSNRRAADVADADDQHRPEHGPSVRGDVVEVLDDVDRGQDVADRIIPAAERRARDIDHVIGLQHEPRAQQQRGGRTGIQLKYLHDLDVQVDVGRYLAGDDGATLTVSRSFHNGWEIGAFVTKTTASADEFGEGSFDKGIVLRVPLGIGWTGETRAQSVQRISSLTGDGGQRLSIRNRLNDMLKPESSPGIFGSTVYCRPGNACAKQATP